MKFPLSSLVVSAALLITSCSPSATTSAGVSYQNVYNCNGTTKDGLEDVSTFLFLRYDRDTGKAGGIFAIDKNYDWKYISGSTKENLSSGSSPEFLNIDVNEIPTGGEVIGKIRKDAFIDKYIFEGSYKNGDKTYQVMLNCLKN